VNILFWNTGTRAPLDEITKLVRGLRVDVLILAECPLSPVKIVAKLNTGARAEFHLPLNQSDRFTFVAALPPRSFTPVYDSAGISVRHLQPPIGQDALLVALHLPSKLFLSAEEQALLAPRTSQMIERLEKRLGHRRTIVIGDFNMNPFEAGLVSSEGFHATMARSIAAKESRTVLGQARRYFYNPMWSLLGDYSTGPPGTFFYSSSSPLAFFWNTFDQVLLRPALANFFQPGDVRVIDSVGSKSLLTSAGLPDHAASDHLPLFAAVRLEETNNVDEEPLGAATRNRRNQNTDASP
jgi:hypothetical protein